MIVFLERPQQDYRGKKRKPKPLLHAKEQEEDMTYEYNSGFNGFVLAKELNLFGTTATKEEKKSIRSCYQMTELQNIVQLTDAEINTFQLLPFRFSFVCFCLFSGSHCSCCMETNGTENILVGGGATANE